MDQEKIVELLNRIHEQANSIQGLREEELTGNDTWHNRVCIGYLKATDIKILVSEAKKYLDKAVKA